MRVLISVTKLSSVQTYHILDLNIIAKISTRQHVFKESMPVLNVTEVFFWSNQFVISMGLVSLLPHPPDSIELSMMQEENRV
jgi:hypothetical protein